MKQAEVSNWWAHADGIQLRVWTRGQSGRVECVGDAWLTPDQIAEFALAVQREQVQTDQYQLTFDD